MKKTDDIIFVRQLSRVQGRTKLDRSSGKAMIWMLNINGVKGPGTSAPAAPAGKEKRGVQGKSEKDVKNEAFRKNFDRTDFADLVKPDSGKVKNSGMKIGAAAEKTDGLSENAKKYLEKLKKKYGNMDFIIADYSGDEEADKLLAQGKGEYNVLITPDLLEKMAADGSAAEEYEGLIESSVADINSIKEGLGDDADMVKSYGVKIGADGTVSITAKLIEGLTGKDGTDTVKGNTVDDMLAQLKEAKESQAEQLAKIREERKNKEEEVTTADTDDADKEVRKLRNSRQNLMSQIRMEQNDDKKSELEEMLRSLDTEISRKDNDSYRRQHAHFETKA